MPKIVCDSCHGLGCWTCKGKGVWEEAANANGDIISGSTISGGSWAGWGTGGNIVSVNISPIGVIKGPPTVPPQPAKAAAPHYSVTGVLFQPPTATRCGSCGIAPAVFTYVIPSYTTPNRSIWACADCGYRMYGNP